ncbi:MAG: hypothetical protein K0B85_10325, partial [Coriobacteriia bacterium]|nr:hypothetical protein [Coriobacteriia bacterium]
TSAVVSIQTDEPSQARVRWGTAAGVLDSGLLSGELATAHTFTLASLDAATTYQFVVSCADEAGNRMMGELLNFQTLPPAETTAPEIAVLEMPIAEWPSRLLVDATDDSGVASVRMAVDGVEQAVDYSAPFEFMWDPSRYADGTHMVDITAVDVAGNESQDTMAIDALSVHDPDRPVTTIFAPVKDSTVAGTITVRASITDDVGIRSVAMMVDAYTRGYIEYPAPYPNAPVAEFTLDTTTLEKGKHSIAVLASDGTWRSAYGSELDLIGIWVDNPPPAPPPKLAVVHRWVKRLGTHFMVAITVKNTGGQEARNVQIIDPVTAFRPVSAETALARYAGVWPTGASATAHMEISPKAAIPPGESRTYTYLLVPFMTGDGSIAAMIGNPETTLRWESPTLPGVYTADEQVVATNDSDGTPVHISHAVAVQSSKHLIVTSPDNLRQHYGAEGADTVLSTSAELAVERGGVLGYLDLSSRFPRDLEADDCLAVGPLSGTGVDEFVIGDVSAQRIYVARVAETVAPGAAGVQISRWEERDLTKSDGFGAGDGIAFFRRGPGGPMGVAWADASANTVSLLDADGKLAAMRSIPFNDGDTLACGDVTGDGRDEIFVFRPGANQVLVYKVVQLTDPTGVLAIEPHNTFAWDIEVRDCIAVGDVWGDGKAEIVIGDVSAQKMFVLEGNGSVVHQPTRIIQEGDRMAVGQPVVSGAAGTSEKDLILHGRRSTGYAVWIKPTGAGVHVLANAGFEKGDLLGAGRFTTGALRDSAVVGSVQENGLELHDPGESGPEVLRSLLAGTEVYIPFVLSDIEPAGAWSKRLHPSWVKDGALTIVGESEIVPSWGNRVFGKVYSNSAGVVAWRQLRADITDYPYASTVGEEIVPELACGRIIGNSAEELCTPMRASIAVARGEPGHGFDRSDVLLVSGFDAGMNGLAAPIDFYSEASGVNKALAWLTGDNRAHMHTPNFVIKKADGSIDEAATRDSIASTFLGLAVDTDVVFLAGHGSPDVWDEIPARKILDEADPFGTADPVVYAAACNTGNYTHPLSFANAMLARGAAAYIGASTWGLSTHSWIANSFFNTWRPGTSAGQAMREVRREVAYLTVPGSSFSNQYTYPDKYAQYWSGIYHLYGDPAFGTEGLASTSGASSSASQMTFTSSAPDETLEAGPNVIEVSVPDYELSRTATHDQVEIPGGQMLVENALPQLPVFVVTREIPKGLAVGDVRVAERSEPVLQGGVDLPPLLDAVVGDEWGVHPVDPPSFAEDSWGRDWWPAAECSWRIVEGVDSDTLAVTLFPVDHSMLTQDLRFFKHWTLAVVVHEAPVRIAGAKTSAATYPAGSPVTLDVALAANEAAPDVTIEVAVRSL